MRTRRVPLLGVLGEFGCRGLGAHVERRPHGRWADRRRCASSDLDQRGLEHGATEWKQNAILVVTSLLSILLLTLSHYGRHRPWDIEGRALKHCAARPRGLPVRDARARRTAIGARHHAARRVVRGRHARHPHERGTLRRDRQVHRRLLLRLTLWALGGLGGFTFILSARGLWSLRRGQPR